MTSAGFKKPTLFGAFLQVPTDRETCDHLYRCSASPSVRIPFTSVSWYWLVHAHRAVLIDCVFLFSRGASVRRADWRLPKLPFVVSGNKARARCLLHAYFPSCPPPNPPLPRMYMSVHHLCALLQCYLIVICEILGASSPSNFHSQVEMMYCSDYAPDATAVHYCLLLFASTRQELFLEKQISHANDRPCTQAVE